MRALVTGSAGFIGSHIASALECAGYETGRLDPADQTSDVRDYCRFKGTKPWDVVVHCAAIVGGRKVMDWTPLDHAANLETDAALFQWAAREHPGRVVYFSSSCAYPVALAQDGHRLREDDINLKQPQWPDQLYGWAKLTGELLAATARDAGIPVSVVRPFSVYGPGVRDGFAVAGFTEQVRRHADPIVIWGDDQQTRDYIHVSDVTGAVLAMVREGINGPVNLGTGRATSLRELAAMMTRAAGYEATVKVDVSLPAGVPFLVADTTRLREFYEPQVTLEAGLAWMMQAACR